MNIYIAGDHFGYSVIRCVREYLLAEGRAFEDLGAKSPNEEVALADMIPRVAKKVLADEGSLGILSCGTGIGVEIGANKFAGIRACLATNEKLADWAVTYDKCNVLCLPGWDLAPDEVFAILRAWFAARYDGDRERLKMFAAFDTWH